MNIYFSGAIAGGRQKQDSYRELINFCKQFATVWNECIGKKNLRVHKSMDIYSRNMDWIDKCDIFIAEVSVPSLGVGMEIEHVIRMQDREVPILCLYDTTQTNPVSKMITNCKHLTLVGYSNIDSAKKAIKDFVEQNGVDLPFVDTASLG